MSIDIDLEINTGKHTVFVVEVGNYTHNVQPMWRKALKAASGSDYGLCDLNGTRASESIPVLEKAVKHMRENKEEYLPLNPTNGWGNYEGALQYLETLLECCQEHPLCTIATSC